MLVILGLLTGGILGGQALIRAAEIRTITNEHGRYVAAIQTFRDKYFAIPGDMANATQFWGAAGVPADCATTLGTGTQTCNGDGDGRVEENNEMYRFWQQLANAGLIEGSYTGIQAVAGQTYSLAAGSNVPRSRMATGAWATRSSSGVPEAAQMFTIDYIGNSLNIGTPSSDINNSWVREALLKPEEAWGVDKKIDDAKPGRGSMVIRGRAGWNNAGGTLARCTLAQSTNDIDADYMLSESGKQCALIFMNAF